MAHKTLEKLARDRAALVERVRDLSDADLDAPHGEGWTIRETLTHLLNAEEDHARIIATVVRGDSDKLPQNLDLDRYNADRIETRGTLPLDALLEGMAAQRARTEALFNRLTPAEMDIAFRHPALGDTTVSKLFRIIGLHEKMHLQDIESALAERG